jgi:hypothetical protein
MGPYDYGYSTSSPDIGMILLILAVVGVVCGLVTMSIARAKNRTAGWFFAGLFLGIVGLIWIACMPALTAGQPGFIDFDARGPMPGEPLASPQAAQVQVQPPAMDAAIGHSRMEPPAPVRRASSRQSDRIRPRARPLERP